LNIGNLQIERLIVDAYSLTSGAVAMIRASNGLRVALAVSSPPNVRPKITFLSAASHS
jgi:hypothetical protein